MSTKESDLIKNMVMSNGDDIGMQEPICLLWKSEHKNCFGCPSELGCSKMTSIMLVEIQPMVDMELGRNTDYDLIALAIDIIMEAKTVKEIRKITDEICH